MSDSQTAPRPARPGIAGAQVVVRCHDVGEVLAFVTEQLGMRVEVISPADDPATAVVSGLGVRLRLVRVDPDEVLVPATIVLTCDDPARVEGGVPFLAPDGLRIELVVADPPLVLPTARATFAITRRADAAEFHIGRAGMAYRDLVPDRLGGALIASHIRIAEPGPVPDYVHFHKVRFQMIYCARGWVRVVYEDQGEPFVMRAGDCVLQPPTIRHRVLDSGDQLEVIELGVPAIHDTYADPAMRLPTGRVLPERTYGDASTTVQRFVRHVAADATWARSPLRGFDVRDTGIAAATGGVAGARVHRRDPSAPTRASAGGALVHDRELFVVYVLAGAVTISAQARGVHQLVAGDCVTVPQHEALDLLEPSDDAELLEVSLPA